MSALKRTGPDEPGSSSKRARFDPRDPLLIQPDDEPTPIAGDDEEENALLESDMTGASVKAKRKSKFVKLQGYDSDSSEDEFFSAALKKRGAEKAKDADDGDGDGDDDMFAEDKPATPPAADGGESSDEDDIDGVSKKSKKLRFLDIDEIEGQDFKSGSKSRRELDAEVERFGRAGKAKADADGDVDLADADEVAVDEDLDPDIGPEGSRRHAPKLEAFNMRDDLEEGKFDEAGNFVRNAADEEAHHDVWLDGISMKDIKSAAQAMESRRQHELAQTLHDDAVTESSLMGMLLDVLEVTETPMEALARLGPGKKKKWQQRGRRKAAAADPAADAADADAERRRKAAVEQIAEAADGLLQKGEKDIYDQTREHIARAYRRSTGQDWSAGAR
ncbi:uncharacterized protein V1510DRAFT_411459 [Dipodascopsis tothii]|uniref:uncharacterized protein n=1 Tax=Dipodascopsis tothii TaxID=44089 RepID=UPI0034CEA176